MALQQTLQRQTPLLQLRDGTGEIQAVVFKGNVSDEVFALADKITQESSVEVTGTVKNTTAQE